MESGLAAPDVKEAVATGAKKKNKERKERELQRGPERKRKASAPEKSRAALRRDLGDDNSKEIPTNRCPQKASRRRGRE